MNLKRNVRWEICSFIIIFYGYIYSYSFNADSPCTIWYKNVWFECCLRLIVAHRVVIHDSTIWATWQVSYKRQELLGHRENIDSYLFLVESMLLIFLVFCVWLCFIYLSLLCVLCTQCCMCLWIVYFWLPLRFSLTCIYNREFNEEHIAYHKCDACRRLHMSCSKYVDF